MSDRDVGEFGSSWRMPSDGDLALALRGGQPRRRETDLVIAATANVIGVTLMTDNVGDFEIIDDLVHARSPEQLRHS